MPSEDSDNEEQLIKTRIVEQKKKTVQTESDESDNSSDEDDYEDIEDGMQYNIVISIDDPSILNEYFSDEDSEYDPNDDDEDEDETDDDNKDKEKISPPVTRSKSKAKKKISEDDESKTKSKKNKNKKKSCVKETKDEPETTSYEEMLDKVLQAKLKGEEEFQKVCNSIVDSQKDRLEKLRKEKEKKENEKTKDKNYHSFRKLLRGNRQPTELKYFSKLEVNEQNFILEQYNEVVKHSKIEEPYKITLIKSTIPSEYKVHAMRKLSTLEYMDNSSNEYYKIKQWIDTFMKIPFGKYTQLPISLEESTQEQIQEFMDNAINKLNTIVYGLDDAKSQIMQMLGQWIANPKSIGNAIAIKGPMGTGKTTLVKEGVSQILNRPFAFIPLGGATDSSFLEGHSYTYEGSIWGKIVDVLISSKYMNPVIYFDELDKISDTPRGEEIAGILTHLTDTSQNDQFHDKYFSGIDFDLSRVLFIFSYNDENKINPILKDRMYHIETRGYTNKEKNIIANQYLVPKIQKNVAFKDGDIIISDEVYEYINSNFTNSEKGVRNLKRCIEIIYNKINLHRLLQPGSTLFNDEKSVEIKLPYTVTLEDINKFIKKKESDYPFNMYT